MTRTDSTTPIWGKIAIVALILIVGGGYVVKLLTNPFAGMDFSIYRLGAMTIFDNEGFTQDLYSPTLNDHGVIKRPRRSRRCCSCRSLLFRWKSAWSLWWSVRLWWRGGSPRSFTTT